MISFHSEMVHITYIHRIIQVCLFMVGTMTVSLGHGQSLGLGDNAACNQINNVFETEGIIEFESFQGEPALGVKQGDKVNLFAMLFQTDAPSSYIRLVFNEQAGALEASAYHGGMQRGADALKRAKGKASCEKNQVILERERSGLSDGSQYQTRSSYKLFVDHEGFLQVEWDVNTRTSIFFVGGTTNQHGRARFRMAHSN